MTPLLMLLLLVGQPMYLPLHCDTLLQVHPIYRPIPPYYPPQPQLTEQDIDDRIAALLFEYEAECYNDSTVRWKYGGTTYTRPDGDLGWRCDSTIDYTSHRNPTFPDFLKWLHRRAEGKQ